MTARKRAEDSRYAYSLGTGRHSNGGYHYPPENSFCLRERLIICGLVVHWYLTRMRQVSSLFLEARQSDEEGRTQIQASQARADVATRAVLKRNLSRDWCESVVQWERGCGTQSGKNS